MVRDSAGAYVRWLQPVRIEFSLPGAKGIPLYNKRSLTGLYSRRLLAKVLKSLCNPGNDQAPFVRADRSSGIYCVLLTTVNAVSTLGVMQLNHARQSVRDLRLALESWFAYNQICGA